MERRLSRGKRTRRIHRSTITTRPSIPTKTAMQAMPAPCFLTSSTWLISCQPIVPSPLFARTAQSSHGESLDTVAYPTGTAMAFTIGKTEGPYRADLPILTPPSTPSPPFPLLERQSTGLPLQIIGIPLNGIGDLAKAGPSPQNVIFSRPQCKPKCRLPWRSSPTIAGG